MSNLFNNLVKLGNKNPDLRGDISPVLHHLEKKALTSNLKSFPEPVQKLVKAYRDRYDVEFDNAKGETGPYVRIGDVEVEYDRGLDSWKIHTGEMLGGDKLSDRELKSLIKKKAKVSNSSKSAADISTSESINDVMLDFASKMGEAFARGAKNFTGVDEVDLERKREGVLVNIKINPDIEFQGMGDLRMEIEISGGNGVYVETRSYAGGRMVNEDGDAMPPDKTISDQVDEGLRALKQIVG